MSAILTPHNDVTVVVVGTDSIVTTNVSRLKQQVSSQLTPHCHLVLDLHNVDFIDSAGCSAILGFVKMLRELGKKVAVCQITRPVRALFDLIRMTRVVDVFPSQEEAIGALAA